MASLFPKCSQAKALILTRNPWRSMVFLRIRCIHASLSQAASNVNAGDTALEEAKQGANAVKGAAEDVKNQTAFAAKDACLKTKNASGKVSETAQDLTEKAKQTVQGAWGSVKETTQKIKDTVVDNAEESKESAK